MGRGLLTDRVALVTGASQGIGEGIAREFAEEGAAVALVARNADNLGRIESEITAQGQQAKSYPLDITDYDLYAKAIADVVDRWGHLDILVNNAMVCFYATILEEGDTIERWRRTMAVNLEAIWMGSKMAVGHMVKQNFGRIISLTSTQAHHSSGTVGAYGSTKGGIIGLTKSMAIELAPYNITVNAIAPGYVRTAACIQDGVDETTTEYFKTHYVGRRRIPMARAGLPKDVAGTAVFLASDYCRYMTAQVLTVDGGLTSTY